MAENKMETKGQQVFIDDDLIERLLRGELNDARKPAKPEAIAAEEPADEAPAPPTAIEESAPEDQPLEPICAHRVLPSPSVLAPVQAEIAAEPEISLQSASYPALAQPVASETNETVEQDLAGEHLAEQDLADQDVAEHETAAEPEPAPLENDEVTAAVESQPEPEALTPVVRKRRSTGSCFSRAVSLAAQGLLEEAIEELQKAAEDPDDALEVHAGVAHLRFGQNNWAAAAEHFAAVAQEEPNHPTAHYNLALCLERQGKFAEAELAFASALEVSPDRWQARLGQGLCLLRVGRSAEALEHLEGAAESAGESLEAHASGARLLDLITFAKAVALHQLGHLREAEGLYRSLEPAHPEAQDLLGNLMAVAAANNNWDEADTRARKLNELDPGSASAKRVLASGPYAQGDYRAAIESGTDLVKMAPESEPAWFNLGLAYQAAGEFESARDAYQQAIRILEVGREHDENVPQKPAAKSAEAYSNLGAVLQQLGDSKAAQDAYLAALEARPGMIGALWNLAVIAEQSGNAVDAERLFGRVAAIRSDWEDVTFRLGTLQYNRGDYGSAADSFESYLQGQPDGADARVNLAICRWKLSQVEPAAEALATVLEQQPEHKGALSCLAAISLEHIGEDHDQQARAAALGLYHKLRDMGHASAELCYNAGVILQQAGDATAARECYQEAIAQKPEFAAALLNLGHAHKAAGNEEEARALWSRAIAAEPALAAEYFG